MHYAYTKSKYNVIYHIISIWKYSTYTVFYSYFFNCLSYKLLVDL